MPRTLELVYNHALNKSKTKEAHSFSKSPRFPQQKHNYSIDLSKSVDFLPQTPTFTISKTSRFIGFLQFRRSIDDTPSPGAYKIESFTEQSAKKKKGIVFDQSPKKKQKIDFIPGPGAYREAKPNPQLRQSFKFSTSKKQVNKHWNRIGPGHYDAKSPKQHNKSTIFDSDNRFKKSYFQNLETPAPGQYIKTQNGIGKRSPQFSFAREERKSKLTPNKKNLSPGPGAYNQSFSQFSERSQRIFSIMNRL